MCPFKKYRSINFNIYKHIDNYDHSQDTDRSHLLPLVVVSPIPSMEKLAFSHNKQDLPFLMFHINERYRIYYCVCLPSLSLMVFRTILVMSCVNRSLFLLGSLYYMDRSQFAPLIEIFVVSSLGLL